MIEELAQERNFGFSIERAVFLATLARLFFPGSDRRVHRLIRDYRIHGVEGIKLHHLYWAMSWLGKERQRIEEALFAKNRNLFSSLSMAFFDTTSLYFEVEGGASLGKKGYSKDRYPDENQMVVGAVLDDCGCPIACPMWPGNTTDVATLFRLQPLLKSALEWQTSPSLPIGAWWEKKTEAHLRKQASPTSLG